MKISILGSTGFVGKVLLRQALEKGFDVKTLVRNPEKLGDLREKVEFIQGDIFEIDKLEKAVSGTEVVLSTVPPQRNTKDPVKYTKAIENLIKILERKKINRIIHIGGAAHDGGKDENWTIGRRMLRLFLNVVWKRFISKTIRMGCIKKIKLKLDFGKASTNNQRSIQW